VRVSLHPGEAFVTEAALFGHALDDLVVGAFEVDH
jgi:hypothetical protein